MNFRVADSSDLPFIVDVYNSTITSRASTADTKTVTVEEMEGWFNKHQATRPVWVIEINNEKQAGFLLRIFMGDLRIKPRQKSVCTFMMHTAIRE